MTMFSGSDASDTVPNVSLTSGKVGFGWVNIATYVRRNGWELRSMPEELARLPENVNVPGKLQEIIQWSLVPGSNWSYQCLTWKNKALMSQEQRLNRSETLKMKSPLAVAGKETSPSMINAGDDSESSYSTSLTQPISTTLEGSPTSGKSLKTKLLSKIGLSRSDNRAVATVEKEPPSTMECTSCFEDFPEADMTRLKSCRHWYCKECLSTLIVTAMATEASFPPKCCLSPIPLKQILKALNGTQREQYQQKAAEYAVPAADRWYCHDKNCLKWIPSNKLRMNREQSYNCPHCLAKLCRFCRGPTHPDGTECPEDFGLEATLETAEIEGWQRCYKCRALVEHNTGCRHMTCRCNAEFCYVCGLRWQTCACTETDAANKRAGVNTRRQERAIQVNAEAEEEAAEIARAIAEVEEMERIEAEERRAEEARRQKEEEEQLIQLEAERQAEEAKKREEAEKAERDFRNVLIKSFEEELNTMVDLHHKIMEFQLSAVNSRHEAESSKFDTMNLKDEEIAKEEFDAFSQLLSRNSSKRRNKIQAKHKADIEALEIQQEEEEDDLFLQVQMRLRGKANKEQRMERMLGEIRKQQEENRNELLDEQKKELEVLEKKIDTDVEGLRRWYDNKVQAARDKRTLALQKFGHTVGADRQYFEMVAERRRQMLALHGQSGLASIEAGEDPVGLTEYEASKVQPCLPEIDDGEEGPSNTSQASNVNMAPQGSSTMSEDYHQQKTPSTMGSGQNTNASTHAEDQELYNGHPPPISRRFSRPPIPGSFPTESPPSNQPSSRLPPPPPPRIRPPPIPQNQPAPPISPQAATAPDMPLRKPVSPTGKSANHLPVSAARNHQLPFFSTPTSPAAQPAQPTRKHIAQAAANSDALPAIAMASLAASMALTGQAVPNGQYDLKTPASSITAIDPNLVPPPLTTKKSKWGFRKPRELNEDEMKKRLRAAVGDAF